MAISRAAGLQKLQSKVDKIREEYAKSMSQYTNFLVYGDFGTGKSTLIGTCPKPIFIDSFDPGGTKTRALQPLIDNGDIVVDNSWEIESWKAPIAFRQWEQEMFTREREGFFEHFGTYALDSVTKWADAIMFRVLEKGDAKHGARKGQTPQLQDYLVQQLTAIDWLGHIMALPCHSVVTGHIGIEKDEVSGRMETGLLLSGKLSRKVPLVFDEKYITRVGREGHILQCHTDGTYHAETRMGGMTKEESKKGPLFNTDEIPDITYLLKKAGKPHADKPSLAEVMEGVEDGE